MNFMTAYKNNVELCCSTFSISELYEILCFFLKKSYPQNKLLADIKFQCIFTNIFWQSLKDCKSNKDC